MNKSSFDLLTKRPVALHVKSLDNKHYHTMRLTVLQLPYRSHWEEKEIMFETSYFMLETEMFKKELWNDLLDLLFRKERRNWLRNRRWMVKKVELLMNDGSWVSRIYRCS